MKALNVLMTTLLVAGSLLSGLVMPPAEAADSKNAAKCVNAKSRKVRTMKAEDLVRQYRMIPHEENGFYLERHYEAKEVGRPASGSIYYYLGPKDISQFHVIDCGEYWTYSAGTPLEIWQITPEGKVSKSLLGIGLGLEPLVYIPAGNIFAARHLPKADDGTFVSCITVPRFEYKGWRLVDKEEIQQKYPEASGFFEE